jgi:tetratricopeptide (TPR) repeat protein
MKFKQGPRCVTGIALCLFSCFLAVSAQSELKVKVIAENANIKATPELGGRVLTRVPINTILDAELKQGEFYKVLWTKDGAPISGYIHEMQVQEVSGAEEQQAVPVVGLAKTQGQIVAEIQMKMDESRQLIIKKKELDTALSNLRPLLARAFAVDDRQLQRQNACEIYYLLGLAYMEKGDYQGALQEFRNMFEVDADYAGNITRLISNPVHSNFIDLADKQYRGILVDFSLEINSDPKEAVIKIDGKNIGKTTPHVYRTPIPKFDLELEKEGFKPYSEAVVLYGPTETRNIKLESSGRTLNISSLPPDAQVFLNGENTGKVTDCELAFVPYGSHIIKLQKKDWADWEEQLQIVDGPGSISIAAVLTAKNYLFARKWGGGIGKFFILPRAICFDQEGNYYIGDKSDFKVRKFGPEGSLQSGWGDAGKELRPLKEPAGIVIDGQGFLYVTDAKSACVMKFAKNGRFVSKWGKEGNQAGELDSPLGIAVDRSNDIYVADSGNNRIVKYSTGGVVKKTWGRQGSGKGEFLHPVGVAVSQKNEILVLDQRRVQIFSTEGELLAAWGKAGTGEGEMNRPQGFSLDTLDYVYIADTGNNRILKFDSGGKFITQWGAPGGADGQMTGPVALAVNDKGSVFVVELAAARIQEFRVPTQ